MLTRAYASQYDSICRDQDSQSDEVDSKITEIQLDCFNGNGTDHLDLEDTIYEHRNTISRLLTEYKFSTVKGSMIESGLTKNQKAMIRPANEIANELMHFLCCLQEKAIEQKADHDVLWSK